MTDATAELPGARFPPNARVFKTLLCSVLRGLFFFLYTTPEIQVTKIDE